MSLVTGCLERAEESLVEAAALLSGAVYEYLVHDKVTEQSVPSGFTGTRRSKKQGIFKRGHYVVQYRQPLHPRLISKYRLSPLSSYDPAVERDGQWSFAADVRTTIIADGLYSIDIGGGKTLVVDMDDNGTWWIMVTNLSGGQVRKPRAFRSLEKVIPNLWEYLSDKSRTFYIKKMLPVF